MPASMSAISWGAASICGSNSVVALRDESIDLSYTDPYFLERNLAAGFDLFADNRDNTSFAGFSQFSLGGTLRGGYQITEALRQTLTYTLRQDRIYNISAHHLALHRGAGGHAQHVGGGPNDALRQARQPPGPDLGVFRLVQLRRRRARRRRGLRARLGAGGRLLSDHARLHHFADRAGRPYPRHRTGRAHRGPLLRRRRQSARLPDRRHRTARFRFTTMRSAARPTMSARCRWHIPWACRRSSASPAACGAISARSSASIRPVPPSKTRRACASRPAPEFRGNRRSDRSKSISASPWSRNPSTGRNCST